MAVKLSWWRGGGKKPNAVNVKLMKMDPYQTRHLQPASIENYEYPSFLSKMEKSHIWDWTRYSPHFHRMSQLTAPQKLDTWDTFRWAIIQIIISYSSVLGNIEINYLL